MKQRFLHVWHGIDQTVIDNAIDEWRGRICACVRAKHGHFEQLLWHYSSMWQETFQCVSNVTRFLDCFFWKLTQIQTSHFRKVVWQHTEGMLVSIICILLQIYFSYQQWKNLENPLRIEKVIVMSLVYYFFGTQCSTQYCNTETVFCQYSPSSRPTSHLKGGQVKERWGQYSPSSRPTIHLKGGQVKERWGQYSPSSRVGEDRAY